MSELSVVGKTNKEMNMKDHEETHKKVSEEEISKTSIIMKMLQQYNSKENPQYPPVWIKITSINPFSIEEIGIKERTITSASLKRSFFESLDTNALMKLKGAKAEILNWCFFDNQEGKPDILVRRIGRVYICPKDYEHPAQKKPEVFFNSQNNETFSFGGKTVGTLISSDSEITTPGGDNEYLLKELHKELEKPAVCSLEKPRIQSAKSTPDRVYALPKENTPDKTLKTSVSKLIKSKEFLEDSACNGFSEKQHKRDPFEENTDFISFPSDPEQDENTTPIAEQQIQESISVEPQQLKAIDKSSRAEEDLAQATEDPKVVISDDNKSDRKSDDLESISAGSVKLNSQRLPQAREGSTIKYVRFVEDNTLETSTISRSKIPSKEISPAPKKNSHDQIENFSESSINKKDKDETTECDSNKTMASTVLMDDLQGLDEDDGDSQTAKHKSIEQTSASDNVEKETQELFRLLSTIPIRYQEIDNKQKNNKKTFLSPYMIGKRAHISLELSSDEDSIADPLGEVEFRLDSDSDSQEQTSLIEKKRDAVGNTQTKPTIIKMDSIPFESFRPKGKVKVYKSSNRFN